jgi:hypothetical protein
MRSQVPPFLKALVPMADDCAYADSQPVGPF